MGAAVGLEVESDDVDQPDDLEIGRKQVRGRPHDGAQRVSLLAREHAHLDRAIGRDLGVERLRQALLEARRDFGQVEVEPCLAGLHVAAGDGHAVVPEHDAAQDVQAGMGAHQQAASLVVESAPNGRAHGRRRVVLVRHEPEVVVGPEADDAGLHTSPQQHTPVRRLAASTRVEGGAVEDDALVRIAGQHRAVPLSQRLVVEFEPVGPAVVIVAHGLQRTVTPSGEEIRDNGRVTRIAILGGGPGGYEAALVAAQLGAEVTVIDRDGLGGSAVLTDCVPSKTLIATAEAMTEAGVSAELGIVLDDTAIGVDLRRVNARVKALAEAQSRDVAGSLEKAGVQVIAGTGRLRQGDRVVVDAADGSSEEFVADVALVATGARPRVLRDAEPDGERILTWTQVYDLDDLPERLIVVGSGVTGAEFASAYNALGAEVVLISSRDRVLPGEDADAAYVLQEVFSRRGLTVLSRSRAASVRRNGDGVAVTLVDGRTVEGSHCLMAVGSVPNTQGIGLEECGVRLEDGGHVEVDRVSRTSGRGVYAAGDCTGVLMLASVAAMQGRIAMWHALGDAVSPLDLKAVSSNVFTAPEIATVGWSQAAVDAREIDARGVKLPLATNARAKMQGIHDGFVKLFCRPGTGIVVGGVVVAPRASELIHPIALAVEDKLTVDQVANAFTVYPSLSGSVAEAARQLHRRG